MNIVSRIEDHHDTLESRAEVALTDMRLGLDLRPREIDRAVMLEVERSSLRSHQSRPRRKAA